VRLTTRAARGVAAFAALLVILPPSPLTAEDWSTAGRLPLRVFTDRDGLPQNAVTTIEFAQDASLWIGTKDGAARYNGQVWTAVPMPKGCTSNWILDIQQAVDGSLWFSTRGGGIARLREGVWTVFAVAEGLPSAEVLALVETRALGGSPVLIAGTVNGLARFDGSRFVPMALPDGLPFDRVTAFFDGGEAGLGAGLWVGLRNGIAHLWKGQWRAFEIPDSSVRPNNPVRGFALTRALDGREKLMAVVTHPVLLEFDGQNWAPRPLEGLATGMVQGILNTRDRDGQETLWVAGQARLARIRDGHVLLLGPDEGFPPEGFWSLAETPDGAGEPALWLGMAGAGLVRFHQEGWTTFDAPRWLVNSSVYALHEESAEDRAEAIWVGTNRGGLVRMSRGQREVYSARQEQIASDTVLSLAETRSVTNQPTLWVGTTGGLSLRRGGRWERFPFRDVLRGATINALVARSSNHGEPGLWVGTGDGLFRIEKGHALNLTEAFGLPDPRVHTVLETDRPGGGRTVWIGTERGLVRHTEGATTIFTTLQGLPSDAVNSLIETREGTKRRLWIGTRGGAARLDLDDPSEAFTTFTTLSSPALPNNNIYQVRQDREGRLYLFTNKGIARFTPRRTTADDSSEYEMYVFTTKDGLPSAECNTGASMVDSRGRVWVGTIQGAAVLTPVPSVSPRAKPLRIERAVLSRTGEVLRAGVPLPYDQGHLTFDFALLNLFRDEDSRYRTQLVGLDSKPSPWTSDAKKEYTSLPEGKYVFRVWGRDVSGTLAGPAEFSFSVRPAPWRTWWAWLAYAVALAALLQAAIRFRLHAVRRRNLELEATISARTSELGEAVLQLKESEQQALQANRAKSTFLASMSHELRTPLNAVIGFAQVLERRAAFRGEDRESLRIILRSGEHLLSLINDVLSLSKIEAGALTLTARPFDFKALLDAVRAIIRVRAEAKGLEVVFEPAEDLPRVVTGDEAKLRQVLINLLGNAVKFTDRGIVTLRVTFASDRARFEVQDTGQGIAPHDISRLFLAFVQTESGQRSSEGTGLGLVISRQIVLLMGGDIQVKSQVGEGSTFTFEVALPASKEPVTQSERGVMGLVPGQKTVRILVVDDTEENRLLLRQLLVSAGFEVQEASSGEAALRQFEDFHPSLILMDVRMKGMDGLEATRRIRAMEMVSGRERSVIVALTAGAFEHEREEMLSGGADDFVAKPFRVATIFEKIARHLGVAYVYEDVLPSDLSSPTRATALSPGRLAAIPKSRLDALHEALAEGDVRRAQVAAEAIRSVDEGLGAALLVEIQAFRLDDLLSVLEKLES